MNNRYHIYVNNDNHVSRWLSIGNWNSSSKYLFELEKLVGCKGYIVYYKNTKPISVIYYSYDKGRGHVVRESVDKFFKNNGTFNNQKYLEHINYSIKQMLDCNDCYQATIKHNKEYIEFLRSRKVIKL